MTAAVGRRPSDGRPVGPPGLLWAGVTILALAAGACGGAAFRPLDVAALRQSRPRTVVAAISGPPTFVVKSGAMTLIPGGQLARVVVGQVMRQEAAGRAVMLRDAGFEDPAALVRAFILPRVVQRLGLQEIDPGSSVTAATAPEAVAAAYRGADLVVDVRTEKWGLGATRTNRLWLEYVGTLRLIDGRTGAVLAEGSCTNPEPASDDLENLAFLAWAFEGGARLKQELWSTANRCADELLARVLRLG